MTQLKQTMSPKLVMTPLGQYAPAQWSGANTSGIRPIGDRVLILPDGAAEQTSGGVELPEDLVDRMTQAAETGVIVAMGPDAWLWNSDRTRKFEGEKPRVGQRVIFERYAGSFQHGPRDGRRYRLMDDKCVGGELDAEVTTAARPLAKVTRPPLVVRP